MAPLYKLKKQCPANTCLTKGGARKRAYDTVKPLADDLGMKVDVSCDRDDPDCVKDVVKHYDGKGNILIWYVSFMYKFVTNG